MFSIQLKKIREAAGFSSQQAFAQKFGVAQSTVGGWESGKREPNFATTIKLARFFNVTVDELLGNTKEPVFRSQALCDQSGYWDGKRLSEERTAQGYSIKQISFLLEISEEEYMCLESGASEPSFALLLRLADVFSYDLEYMCHRAMKYKDPSQQYRGSENLLIKKFRALDERGQSAVWNTLNHEFNSLPGEGDISPAKEA